MKKLKIVEYIGFGNNVDVYEFKLNEKLIKKCCLAGILLVAEYIPISDETEFNFWVYNLIFSYMLYI